MSKVILATASYDKTIRFWEAATGISHRSIPYNDSHINRMEIEPEKQFLAVAGNPHVRFFEINSNNAVPVTSFDGHTGNVSSLGFQKEGHWMYTGSEDGTVKIWDLRASGCQRDFNFGSAVRSVCLHPNQAELIVGLQNGLIKVWDLEENKIVQEHQPDGEVAIQSVAVCPNASYVAAGNNRGKVFFYQLGEEDASTFKLVYTLDAHKSYVLKVLFSPDSKLLATSSADKALKIWNVKDFKLSRSLLGHTRWVWDCVFSADSAYLVSASSDMMARLWDLSQGETIRHYNGHQKAVNCVVLSDW